MNTPTSQPLARVLAQATAGQADPFQDLEAWALLWSQSQNALHVEPIQAMFSSNRRAYTEDRRMDYVPIYIGKEEAVRSLADKIRHTVHARDQVRAEKPRALV
ncbi:MULTISPECIES: hypothetical protein [unclassified Polaromonas]|uniref:hypothetical protein n=2 Tax=Polaromonas TaxID=52972 RepID=UPI0025CE9766|nr:MULTISPECIES: hypothetical protein [unclassified Polaromonas]HQS00775.1 hypothetical protein [Polaromonas sp.]